MTAEAEVQREDQEAGHRRDVEPREVGRDARLQAVEEQQRAARRRGDRPDEREQQRGGRWEHDRVGLELDPADPATDGGRGAPMDVAPPRLNVPRISGGNGTPPR